MKLKVKTECWSLLSTREGTGLLGCNSRGYAVAGWLRGLLVALALLPGGVQAQSASSFDEVGRLYIQNFAPEDYGTPKYGTHTANWDVAQDDRGIIYVANGSGVLQYDGASWRLIPAANLSVIRSLAVGPKGRIFVGAIAEIGYLAPDPQGRLHFVSLARHIPGEDRGFADVWQTHALPSGVYFLCEKRLFRWRDGRIKVWRPETSFYRAFAVRDTLYVTVKTGELFILDRDRLRLAPGGAQFAGQRIFALVPQGPDAVLVVTKKNGLMHCRGDGVCEPYAPELTEILARIEPYCAVPLPGGALAIGTRLGGVVLIDPDGRLIRVLNKASGLRDNSVWNAYVDRQGGLWLALNDGLARVVVTPSLSYFDSTTGLYGAAYHVVRHRGRLHAGTFHGVVVLEAAAGTEPRFVPIPGEARVCTSLVSTDEGLLAGCAEGVYNLERRQQIWESPGGQVSSLHRSRRDPTQLYVGTRNGLARLVLDAGRWRDGGRFEGVWEPIRSFAEDDQGHLWLGTTAHGLLRLEAGTPASDAGILSGAGAVRRFGVDDGLSTGWLDTITVAGEVRVRSFVGGVYRFDSQTDRFVPDDTFTPRGSRSGMGGLTEDDQGRVWIVDLDKSAVARPAADGGYTLEPTALRRIPNMRATDIIAEPGGAVWFLTNQLIRLDPENPFGPEADYPVWIRRVKTSDGSILPAGPAPRWNLAAGINPGERHDVFFDLPVAEEETEAEGEPDAEDAGSAAVETRADIDPDKDRPTSAAAQPASARILVVDDELINRQVLVNQLAAEGYRVAQAASGAEALRQVREQPPDLVLLDVMMPRMSGYEVCKIIRQTHPAEKLPIFFLSVMDRGDDRIAGLENGDNDYLSKPVTKGELLSRVHTHLALLEANRLQEREVNSLRGLLPICVRCKMIRDDEGFWNQIEAYIGQRSEAEFSHGICPTCTEELYPGLLDSGDLEDA